jgi:hypothetical protein
MNTYNASIHVHFSLCIYNHTHRHMYIHLKTHKCIMHYSVHDALFYFQNNNENLKTNSSPSSLTISASWVISWVIKGYFLHL